MISFQTVDVEEKIMLSMMSSRTDVHIEHMAYHVPFDFTDTSLLTWFEVVFC